jgi:hypothetical protein
VITSEIPNTNKLLLFKRWVKLKLLTINFWKNFRDSSFTAIACHTYLECYFFGHIRIINVLQWKLLRASIDDSKTVTKVWVTYVQYGFFKCRFHHYLWLLTTHTIQRSFTLFGTISSDISIIVIIFHCDCEIDSVWS